MFWDEIGERELIGPEIIQGAAEKVALIKRKLETTASRQQSYADPKCRDVESQVGDYVFPKVSPMKGVMRFDKKGKLASKYIGPFKIPGKNWRGCTSVGFAFGYVASTPNIPCLDAEKVYFGSFARVAASW